jgi:Heavy-metal resistance
MSRSLIIFLSALIVGIGVFAGAYVASRHVCVMSEARSTDDLAWLREEFHLDDTEMARIRELHDGYMPHCMEMCARIAAKKREIEVALGAGTNVTAEARKKLGELGELRAQCQAQMLQHFVTVSQAMPPEQGRRYLDEMKRLTLGAHEEMEQSMSSSTGHERGTH